MRIEFSPPDMSDREIQSVISAMKSGWITTGPKTKELEKRIADYCSVKRAVCLNSQTACAEMALRLLGIGPGDEVIVPAYTYTATASVVCHVGAKLVIADISDKSLEMDYQALGDIINKKTKAIIPVDIAGIPCNYELLNKLVEDKKNLFNPSNKIQEAIGRIAICADTAHSFGAYRNGIRAGALADFSSFSFHAVKNITTAEGGALTWKSINGIDDEDIYRKLQLFSLHGQSKDALSKNQMGGWEYDILGPWYKCNMTDILAAIGLAQLDRYSELLEKRKRIIEFYDDKFIGKGINTLKHFTKDYNSSGHLYMTRIPGISIEERQDIIRQMAMRGISCNVHYKPLPMLTAYKNLGFKIEEFPNAYNYFREEITLPLHTKLTVNEIEYLANNYLDIIERFI